MITAKDITVTAPCIYPNTDPIWMFLHTCKRFGITPRLYGQGKLYSGWVDIMLTQLMEEARTCPTSHILYTDSRDAFFLAGLDEIAEKYNAMGCPPLLMGADRIGFCTYQAWYDKVSWDKARAFPYFQVGGMLCHAVSLCWAIHWMFQRAETGEWGRMPGDNPPWWCNFMVERPGELAIDHDCHIFQNCTECMEHLGLDLEIESRGMFKRLSNWLTKSQPCILHFNGGYTDQKIGKWPTMEPWWRKLGYTENPPWEKA